MAAKTIKKVSFSGFLKKFPAIELPITLGNETHLDFSKNNPPLDPLHIQDYIEPFEEVAIDEFTEFIPCFSIPKTEGFHAIVYWRASLMDYQYRLVTFDKKGNGINNKVIAGTFSNGLTITQSVATIDPYWSIHIITGISHVDDKEYDATRSKAIELELFTDGIIGTIEG